MTEEEEKNGALASYSEGCAAQLGMRNTISLYSHTDSSRLSRVSQDDYIPEPQYEVYMLHGIYGPVSPFVE